MRDPVGLFRLKQCLNCVGQLDSKHDTWRNLKGSEDCV
jgi:hypothetical protein